MVVHSAFIEMYHSLRKSEQLISQFLHYSDVKVKYLKIEQERSVATAPGVWRQWLTLEMHHQQQLLLPCLHTSWGACFSCLGTQSVSPIPRQTRNTCGPSHGRWLADQQHVCICILVTYQINLLGPVAGVIFSYYRYMVLLFWHNGSQYTI